MTAPVNTTPGGAWTPEDIASLQNENKALRSALMALPAIAEEIRQQWDIGMKSGKLLIALIDPMLRYRSDITQIHDAAKLAAQREQALLTTLEASRDALRLIAFCAEKQSLTASEKVGDIASVAGRALTAADAALSAARLALNVEGVNGL